MFFVVFLGGGGGGAISSPTYHQFQNVTDPEHYCTDQQLNEAVTDPEVLAEVVQQLKSYGVKNGLKPFELPARSVLPHSTFHLHSSLSFLFET